MFKTRRFVVFLVVFLPVFLISLHEVIAAVPEDTPTEADYNACRKTGEVVLDTCVENPVAPNYYTQKIFCLCRDGQELSIDKGFPGCPSFSSVKSLPLSNFRRLFVFTFIIIGVSSSWLLIKKKNKILGFLLLALVLVCGFWFLVSPNYLPWVQKAQKPIEIEGFLSDLQQEKPYAFGGWQLYLSGGGYYIVGGQKTDLTNNRSLLGKRLRVEGYPSTKVRRVNLRGGWAELRENHLEVVAYEVLPDLPPLPPPPRGGQCEQDSDCLTKVDCSDPLYSKPFCIGGYCKCRV